MTEKVNKINSPLTIIAIFAALAEVNATIAIGLINENLHYIFIWFVIGFPTLLVILFFITLNYNTKVMYSPSDFREDKNFIDSLYGQQSEKSKLPKVDFDNFSKSLEKMESKLLESLNKKINSTSNGTITKSELKEILESQKSEIRQLSKNAIENSNELGFTVSSDLRSEFVKWISYPAYIPIIYAIIKENTPTVSKLKTLEDKYNLPERWDESGLLGLEEIVSIKNDKIIIDNETKEMLIKWVNANEKTILSIIKSFDGNTEKDGERSAINEVARLKAQKLKI
ncbi:hypothetical protein [uncultured Formosa sp.]|uniref:hypothetical protein n=1 Tax=uncultured Formosa sp. TaxID=255435 RepID=UPI00262F16F3|nr:hypothetical protein [uncultured Formosa sp.]